MSNKADRELLAKLEEALVPPEGVQGNAYLTWLFEAEDAAIRVIAEAHEGEVPTQKELAEWSDQEREGSAADTLQEESDRLTALLGNEIELAFLLRSSISIVGNGGDDSVTVDVRDPVPVRWVWERRFADGSRPVLVAAAIGLPPTPPGWLPAHHSTNLLGQVFEEWCSRAREAFEVGSDIPELPVRALARAWQRRPKLPGENHLITLQVTKHRQTTNYNRSPSLVSLIGQPLENANLHTITVDGEPLVSALPKVNEGRVGYRRRSKLAVQGGFSFVPREISHRATGDMVIATLASLPLTGDERSPLRSDLYRLTLLACALTGPTFFDERKGSVLLTGAVTPGGIRRWWEATAVGRGIVIIVDPRTGEWKELMQANSPDEHITVIGPASWWQGKGYMNDWRLSGGLWRPTQLGEATERGPTAGYWGGLHRTINGLEAMLVYGFSAGRGKDGDIPDNLRPERKGGPGPEVFVPWQTVLAGAGEPVTSETLSHSAEGKRYRGRVDALLEAGYQAQGRKPAPAGDTVEIVRVVKGNRWQTGGLMVRASARFCEAVAVSTQASEWTRLPVTRLLKKHR